MIRIVIWVGLLLPVLASSSCDDDQYYDPPASQCRDCPARCSKCTSPSACSSCSTGYALQAAACLPCPLPCAACLPHNLCTACAPKYFLNPNARSCLACSLACLTCSSVTACQLCAEGYYLLNGQCQLCGSGCACNGLLQECQSTGNLKIVAAVIIPLSLLSVIVILVLCWRKKRARTVNPAREYQPDLREASLASLQDHEYKIQPLDLTWQRSPPPQTHKLTPEQTCAICLDCSVNTELPCSHLYHLNCILLWITKQRSCPLCKNEHIDPIKRYCTRCTRYYHSDSLRRLARTAPPPALCADCQAQPQTDTF